MYLRTVFPGIGHTTGILSEQRDRPLPWALIEQSWTEVSQTLQRSDGGRPPSLAMANAWQGDHTIRGLKPNNNALAWLLPYR